MGKHVVVKKDGTVKKKRSCCCTCFLVVFIISLTVLIGGTIGGCIFLNSYTKKHFDMSLGECFGVVRSLYGAKDKKMVTNPYNDADLDGFNTQIKRQLFLKDSAELDVVAAVREMLADTGKTDESETPLENALYRSEPSAEGESDTAAGQDSSAKLLDFLAGLVTEENLDRERLKNYSDETYGEFCLQIKDKELAAFMNAVLQVMAQESDDLREMLEQVGATHLDQVAALRQITFTTENRTYITESGERSTDLKPVAMAYMTLQLRVDEVIDCSMKKHIPNGFLSTLAAWGAKVLLPNDLYITAGFGLDANVGVQLRVNKINTDAKIASAYKLVRGVSSMTGSEFDLESYLTEIATDKIAPAVDKIGSAADYSTMSEHTLVVDTYDAIAGLVDKNEGEEKLTGRQLIGAVSALTASDPAGKLQAEHRYDIWYEKNGVRYRADDPARPTDAALVDYRLAFMEEFDGKYLVDVFERDGDGNFRLDIAGNKIVKPGRSFSELVAAFGMDGGQTDILDLIAMNRFESLVDKSPEDLTVRLTDKMLGAIVAEKLSSSDVGQDLSSMRLSVAQVAVLQRAEADWAAVSVTAEVGDLFDSAGSIGAFMRVFMPSKITVTVEVDITPGRTADARRAPVLYYNDLTAARTAELLGLLEKFGGDGFDLSVVTNDVAGPINEIMDAMYAALDIRVQPSRLTAEKLAAGDSDAYNDVSADPDNGDVCLPSVFKILETQVFTQTVEGEKVSVVTADEIQSVFAALFGFDPMTALPNGQPVAADYAALQQELYDNYYVKDDGQIITSFQELIDLLEKENFAANVHRFDIAKFLAEGPGAGQGKPLLSKGELGRLFAENMENAAGGTGAVADFNVVRVDSVAAAGQQPAALRVLIEVDMSRAMGQTNVMPVDKLYVTVTVHLEKSAVGTDGAGQTVYGYDTEMQVNDMTAVEQENLFKMIRLFAGDGFVDLDALTQDMGRVLYEQLSALTESIGREDAFVCTDDGLVFMSFAEYYQIVSNRN